MDLIIDASVLSAVFFVDDCYDELSFVRKTQIQSQTSVNIYCQTKQMIN